MVSYVHGHRHIRLAVDMLFYQAGLRALLPHPLEISLFIGNAVEVNIFELNLETCGWW